jgi:hypothetical protein
VVAPPVALLAAVAVAVSGCSGSGSTPAATSTTPPNVTPTLATTASTPAVDAAAARALAAAARVMRTVHSYRFDVTERVVAASTQRSRLIGSVVRGEGLSYLLTVGGKRTQVVRLRRATYVRAVPHKWSKLRRSRRLLNPTATLLRILHALRPEQLLRSGQGAVVHGQLAATAARLAGLPASNPALVTVTIDKRGRVVRLVIHSATQSGGQGVDVQLVSDYSGFDSVRPIRKPV